MCRVLVSLLLLCSLVNLNFCRPATKKLSNRIVETSDGALRAVVISRPAFRSVVSMVSGQWSVHGQCSIESSGHLATRSAVGGSVPGRAVRDCRAVPTTDEVHSEMARDQGDARLRTRLSSENSRHGSAISGTSHGSTVFQKNSRLAILNTDTREIQYFPEIPDMDQLSRTMPRGRVQYFRRLTTYLGNQNEDCLNLNLYVPTIHTAAGTSRTELRLVVQCRTVIL